MCGLPSADVVLLGHTCPPVGGWRLRLCLWAVEKHLCGPPIWTRYPSTVTPVATEPVPDYTPHLKVWMTQAELAEHLGVTENYVRVHSAELGGAPLSPGRPNSKKRYFRPLADGAMLARIPQAAVPVPHEVRRGRRRRSAAVRSTTTISGVARIDFRR